MTLTIYGFAIGTLFGAISIDTGNWWQSLLIALACTALGSLFDLLAKYLIKKGIITTKQAKDLQEGLKDVKEDILDDGKLNNSNGSIDELKDVASEIITDYKDDGKANDSNGKEEE